MAIRNCKRNIITKRKRVISKKIDSRNRRNKLKLTFQLL